MYRPRSQVLPFTATAFDSRTGDLMEFKLIQHYGQYVVLLFFPHDTPVCSTESVAFSQLGHKFAERGCVLVGVTVAAPKDLLALKDIRVADGAIEGIDFPILCDSDMSVCKQFGLLNHETGTADRATMILDRSHTVRHLAIYDIRVGRSSTNVLELVMAYQENDKLRLGMPISWELSSRTDSSMPTV